MRRITTNPVEALALTSKENSDLHEEQDRTWRELDLYRDALTKISLMNHCPPAQKVALAALGQRRIA